MEGRVLDAKTSSLVHIGIIAALGLENGLPLHVAMARDAGATKDEIISAILIGLPDGGGRAGELKKALRSYERST
jgi:alkylhydroperoxidase/carboxymuconolactone decarboxylase family protein YurZ